MAETLEVTHANLAALAEHPNPGDGIFQGLNASGDIAVQGYWMMAEDGGGGRDRTLKEQKGVVRVLDGNADEAYRAMSFMGNIQVVANGPHIDAFLEGLALRKVPVESMKAQECGPAAPDFVPAMVGVMSSWGGPGGPSGYQELLVRSAESGITNMPHRSKLLRAGDAGVAQAVYARPANTPPMSSFFADSFPTALPLGESVDEIAEAFWARLSPDNRVGIAIKGIHLATSQAEFSIINT